MTSGDSLLEALRADAPVHQSQNAATVDGWMALASDRPAWMLWGKAQPLAPCPAHPLLCHMVDVAAVAALMLTTRCSERLRIRLLSIHSEPLTALRIVLFVIALHDLGKASPAFQAKVRWVPPLLTARGFALDPNATGKHHGDIGFVFLSEALQSEGLAPAPANKLARTVTAHHGEFPLNEHLTTRQPSTQERGSSPQWDLARKQIVSELKTLFHIDTLNISTKISPAWIAMVAGLCSVADWIGSMQEVFVYETPCESLSSYWNVALSRAETALRLAGILPRDDAFAIPSTFSALFPHFVPWPLHREAERIAASLTAPSLVVVEAPMGEGKTEASLLLSNRVESHLGGQGVFFGLPTQATANQMLGRVQAFLSRTRPEQHSTLQLVHGEADLVERFQQLLAIYDNDSAHSSPVRAERWFLSKKRALLAPYAVGTLDQALLGVMRTAHLFVRLYGLAGKTIVLDEVHAYDAYTSTILERLLEWLGAMGTTVILLSATLPSARREALVAWYWRGAGGHSRRQIPPRCEPVAYPRVTVATQHTLAATSFESRGRPVTVALESLGDDPHEIASYLVKLLRESTGCIGCICNSVSRAQAVFQALGDLDDVPKLLLHARMLPEERARRESVLESWLGPPRENSDNQRPERCIVVGTQVLEQSLDIDFDHLVSDLAPIDLLLQRAGRLHRHVRTSRPARFSSPALVVTRPSDDREHASLKSIAFVYAEAIVRQTLRVLQARRSFTFPTDIEPLVEDVYRSCPPASDALHAAFLEYIGAGLAQKQDAAGRLVPSPSDPDDPFTNLRVHFQDDEDPLLHEQLRAVTRSGPPSVEIVCLVEHNGALFADESLRVPVDLAAEPDRELTRLLVRRSIGVSRPALVQALLKPAADAPSYQPDGWKKNAMLMFRRCVPFTNGVAVVGTTRLTLDPELGLRLENANRPPTQGAH